MPGVGQPSATHAANDIRAFVTEHRLLQRIHASLNRAVRAQADHPLIFMARELRAQRGTEDECELIPPLADVALDSTRELGSFQIDRLSRQMEPPSLDITSEKHLEAVLREAKVDLSVWDRASAKALGHLWAEVRACTSLLRRSAEGELRRVLQYVEVEVQYKGRILVETHRQLGGLTQQKFELVCEKMHAGESWRAAARRCLLDALQLDERCYVLQAWR